MSDILLHATAERQARMQERKFASITLKYPVECGAQLQPLVFHIHTDNLVHVPISPS